MSQIKVSLQTYILEILLSKYRFKLRITLITRIIRCIVNYQLCIINYLSVQSVSSVLSVCYSFLQKNTFRLFFIGFRLLNRKLISAGICVCSYSIVVSRGCAFCRIAYFFQQFAKSIFRILSRVGSSVKHFPYAIDFGHA